MSIKKYKLEFVLFIVNAIYMILELIASRILSPYFGSSNIVWTSIIGIILLSTSIGNYVGGIIADKTKNNNKALKRSISIVLITIGILIFIIPISQQAFLLSLTKIISNIKIGAIISTLSLFFLPSMFIGILSPIIIKLKMNNMENVGKTSGNIYAIATLGSIVGTFIGGFVLIPNFGSNEILFVLSIIQFLLLLFITDEMNKSEKVRIICAIIIALIVNIGCFILFFKINLENGTKVKEGHLRTKVDYDTQYGKIEIYNLMKDGEKIRLLKIDKGNESATYVDKNKKYELIFEYTKYYDHMFKSSKKINNVLMIGGAGYSYPKYFISHYNDKKMDIVEIDGKVTQIAKEYFYLDNLIEEFDLENNDRFNIITQDGRVYLNSNEKKYDAILNDSFSGETPAKTLTTIEAAKQIYKSLNDNGLYLTNIISSLEGENSMFLKSEIKTLKRIFKNVYVIPCNFKDNYDIVQNNMVIATDEDINFTDNARIKYEEGKILTDNYNPIETIIPNM